jgi:general nucleoside transport system ATP-binding protein
LIAAIFIRLYEFTILTPRLELTGITKRYPAVLANDAVNLTVMPGEIHAVLGENGAGKSTLMKVIYGAVRADAGQIKVDGQLVFIESPAAARKFGIAMVFQHFAVFETLTVAENVALGLGSGLSVAQVAARINEVATEYGLPVDPQTPVHSLSVGERQRVEILRALLTNPKVLILDEPTSVLTPQAVHTLFETLRRLASEGCSIIYISHKLDEIRALCHQCTVLRGGKNVGQVDPRQVQASDLAKLMIGNEPPKLQQRPANPGAKVLRVERLVLARNDPFGTDLTDVSLALHSGEILGIAGVSGNGQQALLAALSGEDRRADHQSIMLFDQPVGRLDPEQRRALGLHFVPEERLGRGALPSFTLAQNTLLTRASSGLVKRGWLQPKNAAALAAEIIEKFQVKAGGPQALAGSLSGGNLQKYMMGREISSQPKVFIVAQPTWGVDVGAAAQIRQALIGLRDAGCAVLVVSEELDELFEISDRLQVISQGKLSPSINIAQASKELIGQWMSGLWH